MEMVNGCLVRLVRLVRFERLVRIVCLLRLVLERVNTVLRLLGHN